MSDSAELVLIFNSLHRVLRAEELLEALASDVRVIQVPRRLSSDCGLAVRLEAGCVARAEALLTNAGHLPDEAFRRRGDAWTAEPFGSDGGP